MIKVICDFNKRYLCPMKREYLSKIKDWRNSQIDVLRQSRPLTEDNQQQWFRRINDDDTQVIFAIMELNGKKTKLIGYCGITYIDFVNRRGEISFLVDPLRVNHNNIYREDFLSVLHMLCCYGFERLKLHKIYTETYAFRKYHIKVLEEFGFHLDAMLREHRFVKGKYCASLIHSIIENELPQIKERVKHALGR